MSLTLTILGCGSSAGVPRIGNDWGACDPHNPKNRRLRCSLLVEKHSDAGCTRVLIDTGPDLREQMLAANVSHLDAVLYTHAHADHLHGIDDLRAFWLLSRKRLPVYMDEATWTKAQSAFGYCFETPSWSNYPPILERHPIHAHSPLKITGAGGDLTFQPVPVTHGKIDALGFRVGNSAYIPDVSNISKKSLNYLKNLDLLILDCLRRSRHPSHFCLREALDWTDRIAPAQAVFTNLHCDLDYATLAEELPAHIEPAYDGLRLDLAALTVKTGQTADAG